MNESFDQKFPSGSVNFGRGDCYGMNDNIECGENFIG